MSESRKDVTQSEAEDRDLSRRTFLARTIGTVAMTGAGVLAAGAGAADAKEKVSKVAASYQTRPNNGQRCGGCVHFFFGSCEIVEGSISSQGWCKFFKARA
jgi:hypothetical protein